MKLGKLAGGLWGKLALVVTALAGLLALIGIFKKAGGDAERVKRAAADKRVEARVDAVQPPAAGETSKALKEGRF